MTTNRTTFDVNHSVVSLLNRTVVNVAHNTNPIINIMISERNSFDIYHTTASGTVRSKYEVAHTTSHVIQSSVDKRDTFSASHATTSDIIRTTFNVQHSIKEIEEILTISEIKAFDVSHSTKSKRSIFSLSHDNTTQEEIDDLDGVIIIRRDNESYLDSSIITRQTDDSDILCSIMVHEISDLPSEIVIRQTEKDSLSSRIGVNFDNTMKNDIFIFGYRESNLPSKIDIKYRGNSQIDNALRINSPYKKLVDGFAKDFDSSINIILNKRFDIPSKIGVRYSTRLENTAIINGYGESDLLSSTITVHHTNDLLGEIRVKPYGKMYGIVDIQPPLRMNKTFKPIIDSYIRSGVPKLNYGTAQMLATGYGATRNEIFRSLLRFDISDYVNLGEGYELDSAILKLHYVSRPPTSSITLVMATPEWTEEGVTWFNAPQVGMEVQVGFTVNETDKTIEINLKDFINNLGMYGVQSQVDFYLKNTDESKEANYFYSREVIGSEPKLSVTYYDTRISSQGRANLDSTVMVYHRGNRSLPSSLEVKGYWDSRDLSGELVVTPSGKRYSNIPSSILVATPDRLGSITVQQTKDFDIPSSIAIQNSFYSELEDGQIIVSKPSLPSNTYVLNRYDMPSSLIKRVEGWDDVWGFIYVVPYRDIPGSLDVYYFDLLDSSITARQTTALDIDSTIAVSRPSANFDVYVRPYVFLDGTITVQQEYEEKLPSSINISKPDMSSKVKVTPYKDFKGRISVRVWSDSERDILSSSVIVSRPENQGKIYVRPYDDSFRGTIGVQVEEEHLMDSKLTVSVDRIFGELYIKPYSAIWSSISVRRTEDFDIETQIAVSRPDLISTIQPIIHNDLDGNITVRRTVDEDLNSVIAVPNGFDIESWLFIIGASHLPSSIRANSPYLRSIIAVPAYGHDAISSDITVRRSVDEDIPSRINITIPSSIDGSIIARRTENDELDGSITAQRSGWKQITGKIRTKVVRQLDGKILVRQKTECETPSKIYVLNRSDFKGRIKVGGYETLDGTILVVHRANRYLKGKLLPRIKWADDLYTEIEVTYRGNHDIPSEIQISPTNKMVGIVDIIPPIIAKDVFEPVKDAYIRSGVPRLNYGFAQVLTSGYDKDKVETLRSLLGFDISSLPLGQTIISAKLKITYTTKPTNPYAIYDTDGQWSELGVTWANQPALKDLVLDSYEADIAEEQIVFDIKDYLIGKYAEGDKSIDFILKAIDETADISDIFFSRESAYPPVLEIEYYETNIPSFGRATIDSSIDIKYRGNRQIRGKILVKKLNGYHEMPSSIKVVPAGRRDYEGSITVSRPSLEGSTYILFRSDIPSSIGVGETTYDEIPTSFTVSRPELSSSIYIKTNRDIDSSITVSVTGTSDIFSFGAVTKKIVPSAINILHRDDIDGSITINKLKNFDVPMSVAVSRPEITGSIQAIIRSDRPGSITVRHNDKSLKAGSITVSKPRIDSSIFVKFFRDMPSTIGIPINKEEDIPFTITVSRPQTESSVIVPNRDDFDSKIRVRVWEKWEIPSTFNISRPDLSGNIFVAYTDDIPSTISIRVWGETDEPSLIRVNRPDLSASLEVLERHDIDSSISVRVWEDDNLNSSIFVSRPDVDSAVYIKYARDIDSEITIQRTVDEDIPSFVAVSIPEITGSIKVNGYDDTPSSIIARQNKDSSIVTDITVTRPDLVSSITVNGYTDIPSSILVMIPASDEGIKGTITVSRPDIHISFSVRVYSADDIFGSIEVHEWVDMPSTISARVTDEEDIDSSISVRQEGKKYLDSTISVRRDAEWEIDSSFLISRPDMSGKINIKPYSLLWSSINVIRSDKTSLPSRMAVRFKTKLENEIDIIGVGDSDLPTEIKITPTSDIKASISVLHRDNYDKVSKVIVRGNEDYDIPSKVFVFQVGDSNLKGEVGVRPTNKMTGRVFIIPVDDSDLPSSIMVHEVSDIPSTITARQSDEYDIPSSIDAKQVYDIPGSINARSMSQIPSSIDVWQLYDMPSSIDVWEKSLLDGKIYVLYHRDLDSYIDVITSRAYSFIM
jgi:hypothetical protein